MATNAQGVTIGAAPAGAQQSANGNWVDTASGTQYDTAPGGTSVSSPPATPLPSTPVSTVSSTAAANLVTNKIVPTYNQANTDIQTQNANRAASTASGYIYNVPVVGADGKTTNYSGLAIGLAAYQQSMGAAAGGSSSSSTTPNSTTASNTSGSSAPTPEETIANTPPDNTVWIYNTTTGDRAAMTIGNTPPTGYSLNNPNAVTTPAATPPTAAVTDTANDLNGNTYKKYADGTYGEFDSQGNYIGSASADLFNLNKQSGTIINSWNEVMNGTYPLTPDQQAQITGIQNAYAELIKEQATANANLTGGTTVEMNLFGMGNSLSGIGEIAGTVKAGIAAIAALNDKMNSAVAQMRSGFQTDNLNMVKAGFDMYNTLNQNRQAEIDKQQAAAVAAKQWQADQQRQIAEFNQGEADKVTTAIDNVATEAAKNGASAAIVDQIRNSKDEGTAIQMAVGYMVDPTSSAGEYAAYLKTVPTGKTPVSATDFIAAQKYKDYYAQYAAKAQFDKSAETSAEKDYIGVLKSGITSTRGPIGVQSNKVNLALDAKALYTKYYDATTGNYNVPAAQYAELAINLANLLSNTGAATETTIANITGATAKGDFNKALQYATGVPQNGSTQAVIKNTITSIEVEGQQAESNRNTMLRSLGSLQESGLAPGRADALFNNTVATLPSFTNSNQNSPANMTPDQIATQAQSKVQSFYSNADPNTQKMIDAMWQIPGASYVTIYQHLFPLMGSSTPSITPTP